MSPAILKPVLKERAFMEHPFCRCFGSWALGIQIEGRV
jgi:hypothetical protein